jgi:hypothetical protein
MKQQQNKKRFDLKQAARRLGIGEFTLRRKVYAREIGHYRPTENGKIWFFEDQLLEFEKRRTIPAAV